MSDAESMTTKVEMEGNDLPARVRRDLDISHLNTVTCEDVEALMKTHPRRFERAIFLPTGMGSTGVIDIPPSIGIDYEWIASAAGSGDW